MRRTTSLSALLLGATLLAPTGTATAVGETCRGEAATIVGTGQWVQGTEERDVIVSGAAHVVQSFGGDDLICLSTPADATTIASVDAGPGNDIVDATAFRGSQTSIVLGSGADQFHGSPDGDVVTAGARDMTGGLVPPDNEVDVIDSGEGVDLITSTGGTVPNQDVITAGPGDDHLYVEGPLAADGRLDAGDGVDGLALAAVESGDLSVNATSGTASLEGADWMRWTSVEHLALSLRRVDLTYTGTDADESLYVSTSDSAPTVDAALGGGEDEVTLAAYGTFGPTDIDAGSGRDKVTLLGASTIKADLGKDTLFWGGLTSDFIGVENVAAFGSAVRLVGDNLRNVLSAGRCSTRLSGGGGPDTLSRGALPEDSPAARCSSTTKRGVFDGGPGNDTLEGSRDDDLLRGGAGNDRIIGRQGHDRGLGGPGRDRCSTEIRRSCER